MITPDCSTLAPRIKDLTGQQFGRLLVCSFAGLNKRRNAQWQCQCSCGTFKVVLSQNLLRGSTQSCGCLQRVRTHGLTYTPEYIVWAGMNARCRDINNTKYQNYGGRGITVCERWRTSFAAFLEDMGTRPSPHHTIERLDNNVGYEPSNCCWKTWKEQARNTKRTRLVTFHEETMCLKDWAEKQGMSYTTLFTRLTRGWSIEDALATPSSPHNKKRKRQTDV